jgi:hypothetical protein
MKVANEDVYARIKSAASLKAAGIRLGKPDMAAEGQANYAAAILENTILLYGADIDSVARARLVRIFFDVTSDDDEDATADAEETTQEIEAEARHLRSVTNIADIVPVTELDPETLYDPDNEHYDDEDEEYDPAADFEDEDEA